MKQYKLGVVLVVAVILVGLGFFLNLTTNTILPNGESICHCRIRMRVSC